MTRLVGVSGTHGCGKTTFINDVSEKYGYAYSSEHLSRELQEEQGWSDLTPVTKSFDTMRWFQGELLVRMCARDKFVDRSLDYCMMDRTPIDLAAYTMLWYEHFNIPSDAWLNEYKNFYFESIKENYYSIFILNKLESFVAEQHRASSKTQSRCEALIKGLVSEYKGSEYAGVSCIDILTLDRYNRVTELNGNLT